MQIHKIAVVAGDGIGPEVIAEGVKVLNAVAAIDGDVHDKTRFSHTRTSTDKHKISLSHLNECFIQN